MRTLRTIAVLAVVLFLLACGGATSEQAAQAAETAQVAQAGRLEVRTVEGPSLAGNPLGIPSARRVSIYLPPAYELEPERSFAVVYVLHGIFDTDTTWTVAWPGSEAGFDTIQAIMDRGAGAGDFDEMIVVIPDSEKTCHYTNSPLKGDWEDFIQSDLVGFVDREYRTLARASSRGITGHSMGGHGAIKLGMKYPDVFGAVYGMNPSLLGWGGDLSADNSAFLALETIESPSDVAPRDLYLQALIGTGRCFSPNADAAPFLTDFPFMAQDGEVKRSAPGYDRWQQQMPLHMLDRHADGLTRLRGLVFDSGFDDQFTHIPITSREFSRALDELGIEHVFEEYDGDHRNRLWGRDGRLYGTVFSFFHAFCNRQTESDHDPQAIDQHEPTNLEVAGAGSWRREISAESGAG